MACGILLDQGLNPCPLHCKAGFLTTRLPEKPTPSIFAALGGGAGERWFVDHLLFPEYWVLALGLQRDFRPDFSHIDSHSLDRDVSYKLIMTTQGSSAIKALFPRVWEEGDANECPGTKQWSSQPPTVGTWRWLTLHPDHVADTFSFYDFLEISLATRYGMQDFSSATRVQIPAPAVEAWSLNHWITRDVPTLCLFHFNSYSQVSLPWQNMLS